MTIVESEHRNRIKLATRTGIAVLIPLFAGTLGFLSAPAARHVRVRVISSDEASDNPAIEAGTLRPPRPAQVRIEQTLQSRHSPADVKAKLFRQSLHEIFEDEPRDDAWAPAVEAAIRGPATEYQQAMLPYATDEAVECRSNVCELSMNVPIEKRDEALHLIQGVPLGELQGPSVTEDPARPGQVRIRLAAAFAEGRADAASVAQDITTELARRFPAGYTAVRAHIDAHPEVLQPAPESARGTTP